MNIYKKKIKIVMLGDINVGKTSLTKRISLNHKYNHKNNYTSTIGVGYITKQYNVDFQNKTYKINIEIWDTAGQERYRSLIPMYYHNSDVAVIIYDITDYNTFNSVKIWCNEIFKNSDITLIIIVGNKIDLKCNVPSIIVLNFISNIQQKYIDGPEYVFIETSAKTGHNVSILLDKIINKILLHRLKKIKCIKTSSDQTSESQTNDIIHVNNRNNILTYDYYKKCCSYN